MPPGSGPGPVRSPGRSGRRPAGRRRAAPRPPAAPPPARPAGPAAPAARPGGPWPCPGAGRQTGVQVEIRPVDDCQHRCLGSFLAGDITRGCPPARRSRTAAGRCRWRRVRSPACRGRGGLKAAGSPPRKRLTACSGRMPSTLSAGPVMPRSVTKPSPWGEFARRRWGHGCGCPTRPEPGRPGSTPWPPSRWWPRRGSPPAPHRSPPSA